MPKRNKNRRRNANTYQVSEVQGPQRMPIDGKQIDPPTGIVTVQSDLTKQYLGASLMGLSASLRVLQTQGSDELTQQHGYNLWRQMQRDPEVNAGINTIVEGACAQPTHVVSPLRVDDSDYRKSVKLADFINWMISRFDIDQWKKEQLRMCLTMGNAVSEKDWEFVESGPYTNKLVIDDLRLQEPETYGFIVDQWGKTYGVAPLNQPGGFQMGNVINIDVNGITNLKGAVPTYKLAIWSWKKKGTDPRGTSILIPAHTSWWAKQRALEEWSCWIGRYAQPSIVATPGPDAVAICVTDANGQETTIEPTKALLDALKNFGNASILALAHGSEVEVLQATGGVDPFVKSIQMFNVEISRAILNQHLATNEGQNQSRAAAEVHAIVLRQIINSCRYFMARQFERDIIKPVIEANFGDVGRLMPVVDLGDGDGYPPTITDVAVLLQSGYFTKDQLIKLDRVLGFPVRETDEPAGPQAISNMGKLQDANSNASAPTTRRSRKG